MQESDFFLLKTQVGPPFCELNEAVKARPCYGANKGEPALATWPKTIKFRMDNAAPGIVVPDFITNCFELLMLSPRAKDYFETTLKESIEYLPFKVVTHKRIELDDIYYAANVQGSVDCVDTVRTKGEADGFHPGWYSFVSELRLDVNKIPPDLRIFRPASQPHLVIIHTSLKDELEGQRFTGLRFTPMGLSER